MGAARPHTDKDGVALPEDIVAEAIVTFRANVLFRNFDFKGGADRTLVYVSLFIQLCLRTVEKCADRAEGASHRARAVPHPCAGGGGHNVCARACVCACASGERRLRELAMVAPAIPGDESWPLGSIYPAPRNTSEAGARCTARIDVV